MGEGPRLIAALDNPRAQLGPLAGSLRDVVVGFKVGMPVLVAKGIGALRELRDAAGDSLIIADLKLADIGDVMVRTAEVLKGYVDVVIAHSFVGHAGALDKLKEYLDREGLKLALVTSMSHEGSYEFYDRELISVESLVARLRPWGLVAPATRPWIVRRLRDDLGSEFRILAPGIGTQGAVPGSALCAGADYEIVGRSIVEATNPRVAAEELLRAQEEAIKRCRA